MLVKAMYDNGRLVFDEHVHFAHKRFSVKVEVPDTEVVSKVTSINTPAAQHSSSQSLQADLRAIYKAAITASDVCDDQLNEKQHARWDSALMRTLTKDEGTV
jgi:hypothetical protein